MSRRGNQLFPPLDTWLAMPKRLDGSDLTKESPALKGEEPAQILVGEPDVLLTPCLFLE